MSILVVEDEFLVAAEIQFHLDRGGFREVEHAATEGDALAAIAARDWQGAIIDANLNGVGVERIVEALQEKSIPFIIVTGYGRKGLPQAFADVPVIDKPFRTGTLLDTLRDRMRQGLLKPENNHDNT
jgi:DNA-binding NtrC family response regulator